MRIRLYNPACMLGRSRKRNCLSSSSNNLLCWKMLLALFTLNLVCLLWSEAEGQSVQLVALNGQTSSNLTAGCIEVYYNGQWGTVCDDGFGPLEAHVACRQLGFSAGYLGYGTASGSVLGFSSASSSTPIWLDDLDCRTGYESSLDSCRTRSVGSHNCSHSDDVTLSCLGNGALWLSGTSSGRLEVYYNGQWGTVCIDFFDQTDADIACHQLGYPSAYRYGTVGSLGYRQGSGTIWLDNLHCTSSDLMLSTCSHNGFGNENCIHSYDVAVSCDTDSSTNTTDTSINSDGSSRLSQTGLALAAIGGIIIGVIVPVCCCIGACTLIFVVICTGGEYDCSTNHSVAVRTTTVGKPAAKTTSETTVSTKLPPPYPGINDDYY